MCLCLCVQVGVLAEWVNPFYLDVGVGIQIREQFEEESQVKLDDFLLVSARITHVCPNTVMAAQTYCGPFRRTSTSQCVRP